jgi:translation elongation factor IF5A
MAAAADTLEGTGTGAENANLVPASEVKKGMVVLFDSRPCKVTDVTWCKGGKCGTAKRYLVGNDIFTGKRSTFIGWSAHNITAPFVHTSSRLLVDVQDGFCFLMDHNGDTREDLKLPTTDSADPTLGADIQKALDDDDKEVYVTITKVLDEEAITSFKLGNDTPGTDILQKAVDDDEEAYVIITKAIDNDKITTCKVANDSL